eukprot:CAMPEP_0181445914 /NCGR_PEP_ID=MMETSP1110-20121109/25834_1 /TAXON_ID=174948 /ORGANISM="Symbiodinium sp., Strain CCMP421" /LENGTH=65 /DNA_ID=CAMNT_0023569975 /DNA_START=147 /DNA_END=344 /DNA_ORIENTATION=+
MTISSEDHRGQHAPQGLQDIVVHDLLNVTLKPLLGVDLAGLIDDKLVFSTLELLLNHFVVFLSEV